MEGVGCVFVLFFFCIDVRRNMRPFEYSKLKKLVIRVLESTQLFILKLKEGFGKYSCDIFAIFIYSEQRRSVFKKC